jgi:two-component system, OmpR family, sensor kinase
VMTAFVGIAGLIVLTNGAALYETSKVQARVVALTNTALTSVELAERMGRDVYRRRLLVDAHILEHEAVAMQRLEAEFRQVEADYRNTARAYQATALRPGEVRAWQELENDVRALDAPLAEALNLSRDNQDVEARLALGNLGGRFDLIERDVANLVRINREDADDTLARAARLQRWSSVLFVSALVVGVMLTLVIGIWTTRLVRRRQDEVARYAALLGVRNQELDAFAGRVAHDLRGPLSTISVVASTLSRRGVEEEKTIAILRRGVTRMETLIEDLLALSRIDAAAQGGVCDPVRVAAEVRDDLGARLETEAAALRLSLQPAKVRCAEGLLRVALSNLVDNALKYHRAEAPAEVEITGRSRGQAYDLRVSDHGIGMSYDEVRQAFDPFYRAVRAREKPGTGLGLSIVKRVIEASGGQICIDSELGQGTTFAIDLPLVVDAEGPRGG